MGLKLSTKLIITTKVRMGLTLSTKLIITTKVFVNMLLIKFQTFYVFAVSLHNW